MRIRRTFSTAPVQEQSAQAEVGLRHKVALRQCRNRFEEYPAPPLLRIVPKSDAWEGAGVLNVA